MSIECCQRSPSSLPSSTSPPMHSSLGGGQPSALEQYTFLVPAAEAASSTHQQQRAPRMLRTEVPPTDSVSTGAAAAAPPPPKSRPQVPPRPAGSKPVPPPRHSSTTSSSSTSSTLTSNNNNINTSRGTTTATTSSSAFEPPPARLVNKEWVSEEPSSQSSPLVAETTGSVSHASTSGSSTPRVIRWGKSFDDLLLDREGLDLFTKFLQQEGQLEDLINFYFSCKAIREPLNQLHVAKLARLIIKKYILICNDSLSVSWYLSESVKSKLVQEYKKFYEHNADREPKTGALKESDANNVAKYTDEFYMNLFDEARAEIYNHMNDNLYPNFIRHDLYLRHLR